MKVTCFMSPRAHYVVLERFFHVRLHRVKPILLIRFLGIKRAPGRAVHANQNSGCLGSGWRHGPCSGSVRAGGRPRGSHGNAAPRATVGEWQLSRAAGDRATLSFTGWLTFVSFNSSLCCCINKSSALSSEAARFNWAVYITRKEANLYVKSTCLRDA